MICPYCGVKFEPHSGRHKYCSKQCQNRAYHGYKPKINYTPEQHQFFERKSFENAIFLHLDELRKVHETNSATHLTVCKRRGLIKQGILTISRNGNGSVWNLTPKAVKTLEFVQSS